MKIEGIVLNMSGIKGHEKKLFWRMVYGFCEHNKIPSVPVLHMFLFIGSSQVFKHIEHKALNERFYVRFVYTINFKLTLSDTSYSKLGQC